MRHESPAGPEGVDLARYALPRVVDVIRSIVGEIEALTATGDPPGEHPTDELIVHLRGPQARRAEVRLWAGPYEPARLIALGTEGTLTLEYDPTFHGPARLIHKRPGARKPSPSWGPGTRTRPCSGCSPTRSPAARPTRTCLTAPAPPSWARPPSAACAGGGRWICTMKRSARRATFKSVMTSFGCVLLLGALVALPAALIGPALGMAWTLYIAYAIPPALILFVLLQSLRLAIQGDRISAQRDEEHQDRHKGRESEDQFT